MKTRHFTTRINRRYVNAEFDIQTMESFYEREKMDTGKAICSDMYTIIWIDEASGSMYIDLDVFHLAADTFYCVRPGQALKVKVSEGIKGFIISFRKEFIELYGKNVCELMNAVLFNQSFATTVIKVNADQRKFMNTMAGEMLREAHNCFNLKPEVLKSTLQLFIVYLCRQVKSECPPKLPSRVQELTNYFYLQLENNFFSKKLVRDYAKLLGVTSNHLNTAVKKVSGFAASYHIQQRVVLEAKRQFVFEGSSMKQIAYYLGFLDPSHFSKYFKNSSGVKFSDFVRETTAREYRPGAKHDWR